MSERPIASLHLSRGRRLMANGNPQKPDSGEKVGQLDDGNLAVRIVQLFNAFALIPDSSLKNALFECRGIIRMYLPQDFTEEN